MADPVKVTLQEGDRVVLERRPGGAYALRIFHNGEDQGLLTDPLPPGNPRGTIQTIDRNTTLIVEGSAKNASITIPGNIDFAPRLQIKTNAPLLVTDGAFTLARDSTQPAIVATNINPSGSARLTLGGSSDDERFAANTRVINFQQAGPTRRSIALEDGAPGIQFTNTATSAILLALSGRDSLQQNAKTLRTAVPVAPAAAPPIRPAVPAAEAPAERIPPDAPLNQNQQALINSEVTRIERLQMVARRSTPEVQEAYADIVEAAKRLRSNSPTPTQQDLQTLREAVTTGMTNLERIGQNGNQAVQSTVSILRSSLGASVKGIDRIAQTPAAPGANTGPVVAPSSAPGVSTPATPERPSHARPDIPQQQQANRQLQDLAGQMVSTASLMARDGVIPAQARTFSDAARAVQQNPTKETVEQLNKVLNSTIEQLEGKRSDPRAMMNLQQLKDLRDNLNNLTQNIQAGLHHSNLPEHVQHLARSAINPSLGRQQAAQADHNSINLTGGLPGAGGQIQIT